MLDDEYSDPWGGGIPPSDYPQNPELPPLPPPYTPPPMGDPRANEPPTPAPSGDNTNGSSGTAGGSGVNPWYDPSKEPPSEWLAKGFHWVWNGRMWEQRDANGGNGTVIGKGGGESANGWQLQPFGGGGSYAFPMLSLPEWTPPSALEAPPEFAYEKFDPGAEFTAPKPTEIYSDPSYQFRFDEGMRPVMSQRAAQGILNTGATLKALTRYGQNFASNEYDRIYNRAADTYDRNLSTRYNAWNANRTNALDNYKTNWGVKTDVYDRGYQSSRDAYDRATQKARDEFAPRQRWAELQYNRDWDVYKYQQDDAFRRWAQEGDWANAMATSYPKDNG